jgi:hypothetical protein
MLNKTGYLREAVIRVASDLLGGAIDRESNPEYTRAIVEMARDLIGYVGEAEDANADVIRAVMVMHNRP